jgi:toxin-antitoxin system PIN domain toxin
MILPDTSILIHAYNQNSPRHERARAWWEDTLSGAELVSLAWVAMLGFVRITTSRFVLHNPWSVDEALGQVEGWLAQSNVRIVQPTHRHAEVLTRLLRLVGTAGNLTTDAHLAALAIEHGCTLHSTDADFGRFPGLTWVNPTKE